MSAVQRAVRFRCGADWLYGVLSVPAEQTAASPAAVATAPACTRGVLIITGGPQYRIGSHRQFVLLAAALAARGLPVLRFDYRGMGDSEGAMRDYRCIGADLDSAMAQFFHHVPALREVVLWGLCDGATAAAAYASGEPRVTGLVLLNPWVRTEASLAQTRLRHYYGARLAQLAFWRKLLAGGVRPAAALASVWRLLTASSSTTEVDIDSPPARLYRGLAQFTGQVLIVLSGDDLTAREFAALQRSSAAWRKLSASPRLHQVELAQANHTFSSARWRDRVNRLTADWLLSW